VVTIVPAPFARDSTAIGDDNDAVRHDQNAAANAASVQRAGTIADRRATAQAAAAVTTAQDDLAASAASAHTARHTTEAGLQLARIGAQLARLTNAEAAQPARPSALLQARAGLRSAATSLAGARLTLAQTYLRAPAAGIIVAVNGHVGETPGQSGGHTVSAGGDGGDPFLTMITFAPV
jgi:multidrug resistance efflux pump